MKYKRVFIFVVIQIALVLFFLFSITIIEKNFVQTNSELAVEQLTNNSESYKALGISILSKNIIVGIIWFLFSACTTANIIYVSIYAYKSINIFKSKEKV
jgi:hypothetical protein